MKIHQRALITTVFCLTFFNLVAGNRCSNNQLPCDNGECINRINWCDSDEDCADKSDEKYCEEKGYWSSSDPNDCKDTHFLCKKGPCVPKVAHCDGEIDCSDRSDEDDCLSYTEPVTEAQPKIDADDISYTQSTFEQTTTEWSARKPSTTEWSAEKQTTLPIPKVHWETLHEEVSADSLTRGQQWLLQGRHENWGWGQNTPRALIALGLTDPQRFSGNSKDGKLMKKQLQVLVAINLLRNRTQPVSLSRLATYVHAMMATCQDPTNFHGMDLVRILRMRVTAAQYQRIRTQVFVNPLAYLTLCLFGKTEVNDVHQVMELLSPKTNDQKWYDMQAIAMMAMSCYVKHPNHGINYRPVLQRAVENLLRRIDPNEGHFGNVYTTALSVQALLSTGNITENWDFTLSLNFLKRHQLHNGSFGDLLATYYILPVLASKSLLSLKSQSCNREIPDNDLQPLDTLINGQVPRHYVRYSLYLGKPVEVSYSIMLHVPLNTSFFNVMRIAEHADSRFKFEYEKEGNMITVYSIANTPNDAERGVYWHLYTNLNSQAEQRGYLQNSNQRPYERGVQNLVPIDGDHISFWYRPM